MIEATLQVECETITLAIQIGSVLPALMSESVNDGIDDSFNKHLISSNRVLEISNVLTVP